MSNYRKVIVAVIGLVVMVLQQFFGIGDGDTLLGMPADKLADIVISVGTAVGVFAVANTPSA